ncbi:tetratricopeptide repeat protein [Deinococcus sp.]|uniref:tetratricopeptide repeat protein n=1 Tax=Deinococcus sp. TaxID=47478 RepID=UPI003CC56622
MRATFKRVGTSVLMLLTVTLPAQAQQAAVPPPDIVQLIQKLSKGQELTPAEEKKLDDWSNAQGGSAGTGGASAPAGGAASLLGASRDNDDLQPCPMPPSRAPNADVPDQKGYVALVTAIQARLKLKLNPAQFVTLEQNLSSKGKPQDASNVGLFLLTQNMGSAGAYAISKSALKTPDDATYANNLGMALRGLGGAANLSDAEQVLLYAASQDKKSANIPTNLGWLALDQKRVDAAQTYFRAALVNNKGASQAQAGLGLIALCQGHPKAALPLFRGSLQNGFSDFAEAGVRSAEAVLGQSAKGQQTLAQTPPLFPEVKGVQSGDDVYWKLPPFDSSAVTDALPESRKPLQTYMSDLEDVLKGAQARLSQQALADPHNLDRAPTKAAFVLGDIATITNARLDGPEQALAQAQTDASADLERIQTSATSFTCSAVNIRREQALAVQTRFFPVYAASIHQIDAVLGDMWALGSPWIAHMKYSSDQAGANVQRVTIATSALGLAAQQASLYRGWLSAVMMPDFKKDSQNNSCPLKPAEVLHPIKLGKLKTFPDKGCNLPSESMSIILASYQADCTGIHLSFGEGARLKLDYTFGKDWASDSLSIFGGVGFAESLTVAGNPAGGTLGNSGKSVGVGVNDEVGSYISFTGIGQLVPALDDATSAAGLQNLANTVREGADAFAADPAKYIADYGSAGTAKAGVSGGDIAKVELSVTEKLSAVSGFTSAVSNSSSLGPNTNWKDLD